MITVSPGYLELVPAHRLPDWQHKILNYLPFEELLESLYRPAARLMVLNVVADHRQFEALRQQFEAVMRDLKQCKDPKERMELLRRMKLALDRLDQFIFKGPSPAD